MYFLKLMKILGKKTSTKYFLAVQNADKRELVPILLSNFIHSGNLFQIFFCARLLNP